MVRRAVGTRVRISGNAWSTNHNTPWRFGGCAKLPTNRITGSAASGRGAAKSAKLYGNSVRRDDVRLGVRYDRGLLVRRIQHHVNVTPDGSFQHLHGIRRARDAAITQYLRLLAHPAEVQVGAIIEQADPDVPLQLGEKFSGYLRAAQQRMVEILAVLRQPPAERIGVAAIGDFHADVLQRLGISRTDSADCAARTSPPCPPAAGHG